MNSDASLLLLHINLIEAIGPATIQKILAHYTADELPILYSQSASAILGLLTYFPIK